MANDLSADLHHPIGWRLYGRRLEPTRARRLPVDTVHRRYLWQAECCLEPRHRDRRAEQMVLLFTTAAACEKLALGFRSNAFGNARKSPIFCPRDDDACDGSIVWVIEHVSDEEAVCLQFIERRPLQITPRKVIRSGIVQ